MTDTLRDVLAEALVDAFGYVVDGQRVRTNADAIIAALAARNVVLTRIRSSHVPHAEVDAAAWHAAVCESPTGKAEPAPALDVERLGEAAARLVATFDRVSFVPWNDVESLRDAVKAYEAARVHMVKGYHDAIVAEHVHDWKPWTDEPDETWQACDCGAIVRAVTEDEK